METITPEKVASLQVRRSYLATVDAFEKTELCAQVRGVVRPLGADVEIGRIVKEGEPLIVLDVPDLQAERENKKALLDQAKNLQDQAAQAKVVAGEEVNEALAQEKRYQAEMDYRDVALARVFKLAQGDTVAQQLVDESRLQREAARAAVTAARAQVQTKRVRSSPPRSRSAWPKSRMRVAARNWIGSRSSSVTPPFGPRSRA